MKIKINFLYSKSPDLKTSFSSKSSAGTFILNYFSHLMQRFFLSPRKFFPEKYIRQRAENQLIQHIVYRGNIAKSSYVHKISFLILRIFSPRLPILFFAAAVTLQVVFRLSFQSIIYTFLPR